MSHDYETKLKNLNLPGTTEVVLTYTDGCDVFVHNDTAVDTAIKNTDVVERFSELVEALTQKGDKTHWITEQLRDEYILDFDDEDEDGNVICYRPTADELVSGLRENFGEQQFIDSEVRNYDYKRGHCDLTATVQLTIDELLEVAPDLDGWDIDVETPDGTLTIEG